MPSIRTVPSDTLSDLALAFPDPVDPVIYYNPRLMVRYGVELSAFVLAHERAHIQLGHRRPQTDSGGGGDRDALERLLRSWELDADCVAAAKLARERPAALHAAISFFHQMGANRVDREHPPGNARAARLEVCALEQSGDPRPGEGPRSTTTGPPLK